MASLSDLLATGLTGAIVLSPLPASAHASLASSNPSDGSQVATMPAKVSFTLTEPVRNPALISVTSKDGTRINSENVTVRDRAATSAIDGPVEPGEYTMTYKIISVDGHSVTRTVGFEVLNRSRSTPSPTPTPSTAPQPTTTPLPSPSFDPTGALTPERSTAATTSDDASLNTDALTVVGFSVVAMTGLILILRAGLRSAGTEDDD